MLTASLVLLAALALGGALGLWIGRRRAARDADAAANQARADAAIVAATLHERARGLDAELQKLRAELAQLRGVSDAMRNDLDTARDERAQLAERAARVPVLDAQLLRASEAAASAQQRILQLSTREAELARERDGHRARHAELVQELEVSRQRVAELGQSLAESQSQRAELATRLDAERQQSQEKLVLLTEAKEALTNQFRSLASDILEEKSKRFAEQNQASLGQLLDPLKTRLQEFQGKVEQFYDTEGKQRSALAQQVTQLMDLNRTLSDDAKNLTLALKGSSKSQGNWGELILERVLEASGLRKGEEYDVQESHARDDGSRAQPDVVIHLPEDRHLVVDAKVSLTAYEEYASAETDAQRQVAQRRHLDSIRGHIKGLSERNYQDLYGLQSLDFVLMFVPIEPAFMLGVTQDNKLFMDAWAKNVLLVSPSTLLFVVRTVAHLWRQEAQNRNAQEIARRGAELYDRLAAFVADLTKVGERLDQAQGAYKDAFSKLSTNRGNVIRQAEMLKELGVKPNKALPQKLLEDAGAADDT